MPTIENTAAPSVFIKPGTIAGLRADMYRLLAIGCTDPTRELAQGLIDTGFQMDIRTILADLSIPEKAASRLAAALDELTESICGKDADAFYHELNVEYTRLFIGPGPVVVSPYESIHVDANPDSPPVLMVGPAATAVLKAYREAGLSMLEGLNEPPDHMATELEFMYFLCKKEASAWEEGDDAQATRWQSLQRLFFKEHLEKWGTQFFAQVQDAAQKKFYVVLSLVAVAFFQQEGASSYE